MPYFVFIESFFLWAKNMFVIYLGFFLIMIIDWKIYFLISLPFLQIEKFLNYKLCYKAKLYLVSP